MRFTAAAAFLSLTLWTSLTKVSSYIPFNDQDTVYDYENYEDNDSRAATIVVQDDETLTGVPSFKVKHVDQYFSQSNETWEYRDTSPDVAVESLPIFQTESDDPWKDYSLVVVRKIRQRESQDPTLKIVIKSGYIVKVCQDVIKSWPGISWNAEPLELDSEIFIIFFDKFSQYRDRLAAKKQRKDEEEYLLSAVNLILSTISANYRTTLATLDRLKAHSEISLDLLYSILLPRTVFVATCAVTVGGEPAYYLHGESYDLIDDASQEKAVVGKVQTMILLHSFKGTINITNLDAYPISFYPDPEGLRAALLRRGRKWMGMTGIHHVQYIGTATFRQWGKFTKRSVHGRIMIDRASFRNLNYDYEFPKPYTTTLYASRSNDINFDQYPAELNGDPFMSGFPSPRMFGGPYVHGVPPQATLNANPSNENLSDDQLILTPSIVYGFSLPDKMWLEFDVEKIQPIKWNEEAFADLVIPAPREDLLRSLVDAHHHDLGFDDFIPGKGQGLVINLFGPLGVGKIFSAEATSEHVKSPLYVVDGGELGTTAEALDLCLERILNVATAWKAIVLIDEADIFLEQRSLHDLERNAMVAVFLCHLDYYRGILFLASSRVQVFDEAFLSRIHVAFLHLSELNQESKKQVWSAFIKKLTASHTITAGQITELAKRNVNGRQIKNAVRTAQYLAVGRGEVLEYGHFVETLDAMSEFTKEFIALKKGLGN